MYEETFFALSWDSLAGVCEFSHGFLHTCEAALVHRPTQQFCKAPLAPGEVTLARKEENSREAFKWTGLRVSSISSHFTLHRHHSVYSYSALLSNPTQDSEEVPNVDYFSSTPPLSPRN